MKVPARLTSAQALVLEAMEDGAVLHRKARWWFAGEYRSVYWLTARGLERTGLIQATNPEAEVRLYEVTGEGRAALVFYREKVPSLNGAGLPRNRSIEVRTAEDGLWNKVRWEGALQHFAVISGDGSWVEPGEVEEWRDAPHPAIRVGAAQKRGPNHRLS